MRDLLRLFRVRNYPNYLVVVIAAMAATDGHPPVKKLAMAFLLFGVCLYNGIYILNEVIDADLDRLHPVKKERPVPSGRVPVWQALTLAGVLWTIAFVASDRAYLPLYLAFVAVNLVYSFVLKRRGFRNAIAVTSALRVSLGFVIAGQSALWAPGLMLLCTLFMAGVQQAKFSVEGTIGSEHSGAKLLTIAALMAPVSFWCWSAHPLVVLWTNFAMVAWVFVPWRFPPTAHWLIGADVPSRNLPATSTPLPDMVIFDVDGTLCDSMIAILNAVNEMAPVLGFKVITDEQFRQFRAMTVRGILQTLGINTWQLIRLGRHVRGALRSRAAELKPIPGIAEELRALRAAGYRLAIVSSNQRSNVEAFLRAQGLDYFDEINTHNGFGSGLWRKRRQLTDLMKAQRRSVGRFVYVGDEIRDIEASRAAGLPVIAVGWGANTAEVLAAAQPTVLIHSPADLQDAVRNAIARQATELEPAVPWQAPASA
jgi:phosphoglycolate phosphatase